VPVFALSVHADYACRHVGACCTAGWRIPVEPEQRRVIPVEALVPDASGACGFYDRPSGLCRIQRDHGAAALPRSCDQFPRVSLRDGRGTVVTLSHFCPTAARLLVEDVAPLEIVRSPAAFPDDRFYDALDARDEWPPLLRPSLLFDLDTYSRWERFVVGQLANDALSIGRRLDLIAAAADSLRAWSPESGDLTAHALAVFDRSDPGVSRPRRYAQFSGPHAYGRAGGLARRIEADAPAEMRVRASGTIDVRDFDSVEWGAFGPAVARYLAAKAFGSWCAYQGRGVRTLVAELILSETVLRVEAMRAMAIAGMPITPELMIDALRAADRLLVHSLERERLMAWLDVVERDDDSSGADGHDAPRARSGAASL
jgi:hypothetical protein